MLVSPYSVFVTAIDRKLPLKKVFYIACEKVLRGNSWKIKTFQFCIWYSKSTDKPIYKFHTEEIEFLTRSDN